MNRNIIIKKIEKQLQKKLPGKKAQYKMAPELRDIRLNNLKKNQLEKKSGVLILLYYKKDTLFICLIKRPEYDGHHSGQVSFPGGKFEEKDNNLIQTALRETYEEVGVSPGKIKILGALTKLKIPVSQMEVYPVVGFLTNSTVFKIDKHEVSYIIEAEINDFLNPQNVKTMTLNLNGQNISAPYYSVNNEVIWGATAMMLSEFLEIYKVI